MKYFWIIMLILNLGLTKPQGGLFNSDLSSFLAGFFSAEETQGSEGLYVTDEGDTVIDVPEGIGFGGF